MNRFTFLLAVACVVAAGPRLAAQDDAADIAKAQREYEAQQAKVRAELAKKATHEQTAEIKVDGANGAALQTLCLGADGKVFALVAPPRGFSAPAKGATGEVKVYSADGKLEASWKLDFAAHSLNAGPDGTVYVAGDARVARFGKDGKAVGAPAELSYITDLLKDKDALRAKAEVSLKREKELMAKSMADAKKQFAEQVAKLEAKAEADRTKTEQRQLSQYKSILKSYEQNENFYAKRTVEDVMSGLIGRLRIVNGIAVSESHVFVACGEAEGYGYAVWRMDRELKNAKQILSGIGGCCGQMDIQVQGGDLLVAENTRHQFARYDRDGKKLGSFGRRGQDTDPACFGGCCNPMNVRAAGSSGDVFTAESEGVVKRFSAAGEFAGVVGTVPVNGGCKNVAIGVSADGTRVYFCDQPGGRFFILTRKPAPAAGGQ